MAAEKTGFPRYAKKEAYLQVGLTFFMVLIWHTRFSTSYIMRRGNAAEIVTSNYARGRSICKNKPLFATDYLTSTFGFDSAEVSKQQNLVSN